MTDDLPPYPTGDVVGPCVCGSWPGGKCLRCKVVPPTEPYKLPQSFVEHWLAQATNAFMFGALITDLSRDELIATAAFCISSNITTREEAARRGKLAADLTKLRGK